MTDSKIIQEEMDALFLSLSEHAGFIVKVLDIDRHLEIMQESFQDYASELGKNPDDLTSDERFTAVMKGTLKSMDEGIAEKEVTQ